MTTRIEFNQELQGVVRHLLQCADREAEARSAHTNMTEIAELGDDLFIENVPLALEKTQQALTISGAKTDAAIMEFTDRLYDAIYEDRAESMLEAARLGATG